MTDEQRYYQEEQLKLQKEQLELAKTSTQEPTKSVMGNMSEASASTEQAAALRRGISSTFNRPSAFTTYGSGSATSGSTTKLGN